MSKPIIFDGSIPQNYEHYLTPFLFDPYAKDLVERIDTANVKNALELACGTGCVTKLLLKHLPASAQLTATDLQTDMLDIAKSNLSLPNITWDIVDMTNIQYEDNLFDLIVCQFGLMLVPEKLQAITEMYRVLKKGGSLIFNVWGNIEDNKVWEIGGKIIESFFGIDPILLDPGPFSLSKENDTLQLLKIAGFEDIKVTTVNKTGKIETAAMAARGFIEGLPVFVTISKKNPDLVPKIQEALELELNNQLGNYPMESTLQALVFETKK